MILLLILGTLPAFSGLQGIGKEVAVLPFDTLNPKGNATAAQAEGLRCKGMGRVMTVFLSRQYDALPENPCLPIIICLILAGVSSTV